MIKFWWLSEITQLKGTGYESRQHAKLDNALSVHALNLTTWYICWFLSF